MTNTTTAPRYYTCLECGARTLVLSTMEYAMVSHMVNAGEITVGEARAELASGCLHDQASVQLLAGWVLDRADQGDHWRAGDQELLPCGCIVSYDRTQVGEACETAACLLPRALFTDLTR